MLAIVLLWRFRPVSWLICVSSPPQLILVLLYQACWLGVSTRLASTLPASAAQGPRRSRNLYSKCLISCNQHKTNDERTRSSLNSVQSGHLVDRYSMIFSHGKSSYAGNLSCTAVDWHGAASNFWVGLFRREIQELSVPRRRIIVEGLV
jgi:hypothetical protein